MDVGGRTFFSLEHWAALDVTQSITPIDCTIAVVVVAAAVVCWNQFPRRFVAMFERLAFPSPSRLGRSQVAWYVMYTHKNLRYLSARYTSIMRLPAATLIIIAFWPGKCRSLFVSLSLCVVPERTSVWMYVCLCMPLLMPLLLLVPNVFMR